MHWLIFFFFHTHNKCNNIITHNNSTLLYVAIFRCTARLCWDRLIVFGLAYRKVPEVPSCG